MTHVNLVRRFSAEKVKMGSLVSEKLRKKGNVAYAKACAAGTFAPVVRSSRILDASKLYRQALDASRDESSRAKCNKNLGAAHWKHASSCLETSNRNGRGFDGRPPSYHVEVSVDSYLAAFRHGRLSRQSTEWLQDIEQRLQAICDDVIQKYSYVLDAPHFVSNISKLFQADSELSIGTSSAVATFQLGVAQRIFDEAVEELGGNVSAECSNYQKCLSLLHACYTPLHEAEKHAEKSDEKNTGKNAGKSAGTAKAETKAEEDVDETATICLLDKVRALKFLVESTKAKCESIRAIAAGRKLLENTSKARNRALRRGLVLSALDKFKEAAILARGGMDTDCEAEALTNVGNVYKDFLMEDEKAQQHYSAVVSMTQISDATHSTTWYKKALTLFNYFKRKKERADRTREEVAKLEAVGKKSTTKDFLHYVYANHPPRRDDGKCYLGDRELPTAGSIRLALRKAMLHYHPDHNAVTDDEDWKVVCGEITKMLVDKMSLYSVEKSAHI